MLLAHTFLARAASPAIDLTGPTSTDELRGHIDYLLDPDGTLNIGDVRTPKVAEAFAPVSGRNPDFGYTQSAIWLRFELVNRTEITARWRLLFRENFLRLLEVYQVRPDGSTTTLITQDERSPFNSRPLSYPELAAAMDIAPQERSAIYVRYGSSGSSGLSFSIETEQSFDQVATRTTAKNFIYYGMMLVLIAIALIAFLVVRRAIFLAYAGYSVSALLFIMHADGNAFKFLWPEAPLFNSFAAIALGSGIIVFGSIYSMLFLQTRRLHPILDILLYGIIATTAGTVASALILDQQTVKKMLVMLAFLAIALFVICGLVAARHRFKQVRFYVIAWAGALISSALMTGQHWLGIEIPEEAQLDSMRLVMVLDAVLMGLAIGDYFNQARKARQEALQASLLQTQRNLQLSQRLNELEQQYAMARKLAETQERKIADTIHDLNQPLHALRLNVRSLAAGVDAGSSARIEETFTYLERLVAAHLERSVAGFGTNTIAEDTRDESGGLGVREVLSSIHEMFLPDAESRGLKFKLVATGAEVDCEPLVLMRIISNLVGNAIKYTETGGVLLGCRRANGVLRIEVHDTGPGMSVEEFARVKARAVRLDRDVGQREGSGLGLSIAHSLAESRGYSLTLARNRRNGTGIVLSIPGERQPS